MTGDGAILFRHLQQMAFVKAGPAVDGSRGVDAAERNAGPPRMRRNPLRVICDGDPAEERHDG